MCVCVCVCMCVYVCVRGCVKMWMCGSVYMGMCEYTLESVDVVVIKCGVTVVAISATR